MDGVFREIGGMVESVTRALAVMNCAIDSGKSSTACFVAKKA
jgi:hypothetical protein